MFLGLPFAAIPTLFLGLILQVDGIVFAEEHKPSSDLEKTESSGEKSSHEGGAQKKSEAKEKAHKKKSGGKAAKSSHDKPEEGESAEQAEEPSPESEEDAKMKRAAEDSAFTPYYVHRWVNFPEIKAEKLNGTPLVLKAERGYITVVYFLASWCIPCQELTGAFQQLEKKFKRSPIRFVYVFSHDIRAEAVGFSKEFHMDSKESTSQVLLAGHDLLKSFHNPELPSIYVSDRDQFLLTRYIKAGPKQIEDLEKALGTLTSY